METITEKLGIEDIDVYASILFLVSLVIDIDIKGGVDGDLMAAIRSFVRTRIGKEVYQKIHELIPDELDPFMMRHGLTTNESADA